MKIDQLSREYNIVPEVLEIAGMVTDVTGKGLDVQLVVNLATDAVTKIARGRMPRHIVTIKENSTYRINHVVAHECGHILRIMQADPADRVVPSTNPTTAVKTYNDVKPAMFAFTSPGKEELFTIWINSLINQLINLPADLRIEQWLYNKYPSFKEVQIKSLTIDVQNRLAGLSKEVKEYTPKTIFEKNNAMDYAYLLGLSQVTGLDYTDHYKKHDNIKKIGCWLYKLLEVQDRGFSQDIEITNKWAEMLGMDGWFTWIGFESIPEMYCE